MVFAMVQTSTLTGNCLARHFLVSCRRLRTMLFLGFFPNGGGGEGRQNEDMGTKVYNEEGEKRMKV